MTQLARISADPGTKRAESKVIALPTGSLTLGVVDGDWPIEHLLGFAARRNPKRGFLFVSRVLGRYTPVRASALRAAQQALLDRLPSDIEGPIVVVGVAEAGVGLAQGIHELLLDSVGRRDALFLPSTRYQLDRRTAAEFSEPHSHAPKHYLYEPIGARERTLLDEAKTLIVIDDEATTGRTFQNLVAALTPRMARLQRALQLVLTDWSHGRVPATADRISLMRGWYRFESSGFVPRMPDVRGKSESKSGLLRGNYGRLGLSSSLQLPLPDVLCDVRPSERVLIVGTGEFHYPAFRWAEELERGGVNAHFQATTRAPVMLGHEIRSILEVGNCYGDDMPDYLYNASAAYDRVVVCHETPPGSACPRLLKSLRAIPVYLG